MPIRIPHFLLPAPPAMRRVLVFALLLALAAPAFADGLLLADDRDYPGRLLRNRTTHVKVIIHGLVAETIVTQEFDNEWDRPVDGVYSFPLPPEARSTQLLYSRGDTLFKAVLQVQQQTANPGTGEGGIPALVNAYIGRNGLRLGLQDIRPGRPQRVILHYVSLLDYHQGTATYRYPFDTAGLFSRPLDHLEVDVDVRSSLPLVDAGLRSHDGMETRSATSDRFVGRLIAPRTYPIDDIVFEYTTASTDLSVDLYSIASELQQADPNGHFALIVRPPPTAQDAEVLPKTVVFLASISSTMAGFKLEQSLQGLREGLDQLREGDFFNVMAYNAGVERWRIAPVAATAANLEAASAWIASLSASGGSQLDLALDNALNQFASDDRVNVLIPFTDGRSQIDPRQLADRNANRVGIFPVGIGDELARERLEMTAALNYGFVTYFDEESDLRGGLVQLFEQISAPVIQAPAVFFRIGGIRDIARERYPAVFAGSYFAVAGRYSQPGDAEVTLTGTAVGGRTDLTFPVNFTQAADTNRFPAHLWAKDVIDQLEREIEIYGETEALRDSVIALSLRYELRSRYTAYVATYDEGDVESTDVEEEAPQPATRSEIASIYPNPFTTYATARIFLAPETARSATKLLKIYDVLGRLVAVIDLSNLGPGWHRVRLDPSQFFGPVPSGVYFAHLQVGNDVVSTQQLHYIR
ncbi:MAG: VWA domain-containing protein [Bacteroidota bacterium]